MDGEGVGIDVEEAILEVSYPFNLFLDYSWCQANDDDEVDGVMVYYPIYGGRQVGILQFQKVERSWWEGPVPPISGLRRKGRRRIKPPIPIQSLPQVSPFHPNHKIEANKKATDSSPP